ncbi:MAG: succinate dehydrogenase cytochrome b subunit [Sphingobacteriaceae bacterium]
MSNFKNTFSSSLGKKLIMALTGIFLCTFLVVHLIGNLQLFKNDGGKAFNDYAYFMTHFPPIKVVSYLLYTSIIVHALYALVLTMGNRKARGTSYGAYAGSANSPWTSRNMGILGTILLVFIVVHMNNFWAQYHWGAIPGVEYRTNLLSHETTQTALPAGSVVEYTKYTENGVEITRARDLYAVTAYAFKTWWLVALYVFAMGALAFHLIHGFRSAFQTIGWDNNRYVPIIRFLGVWVFGVLIPLAFAAMPLYFFFCK